MPPPAMVFIPTPLASAGTHNNFNPLLRKTEVRVLRNIRIFFELACGRYKKCTKMDSNVKKMNKCQSVNY